MYTIIANDMGKEVALGTRGAGVNTIYCGLYVGEVELPETDGYCGPFDDAIRMLPAVCPLC
jgi:hypothetical protein